MERSSTKLTKRDVDQLAPNGKRFLVWDNELAGFGLRIASTGLKTFVVRYRAEGGGRTAPQHLLAIGRYGVLTPEEARKRAKAILGSVAKGEDPAREQLATRQQITVAQLCDRYLKEGVLIPTRSGTVKKASTVKDDQGRIEAHIKPLLGHRRVSSITSADIERFLVDVASGKTRTAPAETEHRNPVRGGKGVATRTTATLGAIFTFARRQGLRPDNPVHGVAKYANKPKERFLTTDELERLGAAIRESETTGIPWEVDEHAPKAKHLAKHEKRFTTINPFAAAALRLLLFTGCRLREITLLAELFDDTSSTRKLFPWRLTFESRTRGRPPGDLMRKKATQFSMMLAVKNELAKEKKVDLAIEKVAGSFNCSKATVYKAWSEFNEPSRPSSK